MLAIAAAAKPVFSATWERDASGRKNRSVEQRRFIRRDIPVVLHAGAGAHRSQTRLDLDELKAGAAACRALFDNLIRPQQKRLRDRQANALAVFMLMTSSNFVGCSTGRSPGLAPCP